MYSYMDFSRFSGEKSFALNSTQQIIFNNFSVLFHCLMDGMEML